MEAVHPLHHGQVHVAVDDEVVADMDPLEHQDAALQLDLAFGVSPETTASGGDTARFQRAPERADQSTGRRSDNVVEGGGVWRAGIGRHAVVLGHLAVDAERDGIGLGRQPRPAQRALLPLDAHLGPVDDLTHAVAPSVADQLQANDPDRGRQRVACPFEERLKVSEAGGRPILVAADVSDEQAVDQMFDQVLSEYGRPEDRKSTRLNSSH